MLNLDRVERLVWDELRALAGWEVLEEEDFVFGIVWDFADPSFAEEV